MAADREVIPCFGVLCTQRGNCQCYAAVEFSAAAMRMDYCPINRTTGERTHFVPIFPQRVGCVEVERRVAT